MIWSLQILRFVAALLVVYVHAVQVAIGSTGSSGILPIELHAVGQAGVDIFFVISGFIIARCAAGASWQEFSRKRFRRIIPIYYIVCIPVTVVAVRNGLDVTWRDLLASVLLWPATDVMTVPILGVAWTLCFEALFYVSAALVIANRRLLAPIAVIFAASMLLREHGPVFQFLGNPLILEFLLGVAVAYAPTEWRAVWLIPVGAIALVSAGFMGTAPAGDTIDFLVGDGNVQRVLVYGVPAALIVYGVTQVEARESEWTRQGDASYALYLTHPLVMSSLLAFWKAVPLPADLIILVSMAVSVFFGWRIHLAIERPLLQFLDRPGLKNHQLRAG